MRMPEKCRNNNNKHDNSDNPLTSCRTDGGKKRDLGRIYSLGLMTDTKIGPYSIKPI